MTELFRVTTHGVEPISESPFLSEVSDLEDFVIANPSLLGEGTSVVARQVNAGAAGRLDILALTQALAGGQVAVVELKNGAADIHVLLQALRYASWAVGNPDSVRLLLSNAKVNPGEVDLRPRIVVAAPVIQDELVELSQYVGAFEFDFVEIKRFAQGEQLFVVVTHKAPSVSPPPGVTWQGEWDWERYEKVLGWKNERVAFGRRLLERVEAKVQANDWPLPCKFRKGYIPLQLGGTKNVVGIQPKTAHDWYLWFRLPRSPADLNLPRISRQSKWDQAWKVLNVVITDPEDDLDELDPYFDAAYQAATGVLS